MLLKVNYFVVEKGKNLINRVFIKLTANIILLNKPE